MDGLARCQQDRERNGGGNCGEGMKSDDGPCTCERDTRAARVRKKVKGDRIH